MPAIRVLLVEDHALVRSGIRALLQRFPTIEVIGEANDGHEALALCARHQPDIVLMDISMASLNGLEATARIVKQYPHTRVLVLSMYANEEYVIQALRAGAAGYLLKGADVAELEMALVAVARGETYLTPPVSRYVVADYLDRVQTGATPAERLTPRQREVLQLVAEGHTTKDIARKLGVSVKTVETHRTEVMNRLDIHDVAGLVRYAVREGIVSTED